MKKFVIIRTTTIVSEIEIEAESFDDADERYCMGEFEYELADAQTEQWNVVDEDTVIKEPLVMIYYNDVFVSGTPNEIYKGCPYVNVSINDAIEYAENKIENGEWEAYCIPSLVNHDVIYHNEINRYTKGTL